MLPLRPPGSVHFPPGNTAESTLIAADDIMHRPPTVRTLIVINYPGTIIPADPAFAVINWTSYTTRLRRSGVPTAYVIQRIICQRFGHIFCKDAFCSTVCHLLRRFLLHFAHIASMPLPRSGSKLIKIFVTIQSPFAKSSYIPQVSWFRSATLHQSAVEAAIRLCFPFVHLTGFAL